MDELLISIFAQPRPGGYEHARLRELVEGFPVEQAFLRMREGDEVTGDDGVYVRYAADGGHVEALLGNLGLPADVAVVVERAMATGPRFRPRLDRKQLAALSDIEALADKCGVPMSEHELRRAFHEGFRFDDDRPADLLDGRIRRDLHERALAAATEAQITAYPRFFAAERIADSPSAASIGVDDIAGEDLARLTAFLRSQLS